MILFPAIDIKDGKCVRLYQGDFNRSKIYNVDPVDQAKYFEKLGFKWIHIVDLDGAKDGKHVNSETVERILLETDLQVQLGGGIRNLDAILKWMKLGIKRLVLGTMAVTDKETVRKAIQLYPGRLVLGVDAKGDFVAVEGWEKTTQIKADELINSYADLDVAGVVYTDISRDGALLGPNLEATIALAQTTPFPVTLSGGVSCFEDLLRIKNNESHGLEGVICGRAFYENTIDPSMAIKIFSD